MQFKHILYWGAILCAIGQLLLALYARFYGGIVAEIDAAGDVPVYSEIAIMRAMNFALPASVFCLAMLLYTWKLNNVGRFAFLVAICLQAGAMDLNLRAVRHVFGEGVKLETLAWWYPTAETVDTFIGG